MTEYLQLGPIFASDFGRGAEKASRDHFDAHLGAQIRTKLAREAAE